VGQEICCLPERAANEKNNAAGDLAIGLCVWASFHSVKSIQEKGSMAVKRIVANVGANSTASAEAFYRDVLDLKVVMDLGWIVKFAAESSALPQVSVLTEGGSGTPVPDISIEVDNLDEVHRRAIVGQAPIWREEHA
jgi:hypothetical protein